MSEPIPESIPTSFDKRSKRPLKRRALTPTTAQAASLDALFAKPDINIPLPSNTVSKKPTVAEPPEIVANVQGSSAGAGSGEFHVYKASRRREYERVKAMDEEVEREKKDEEYELERAEKKRRDEEKTEKNRKRREKKKNKGKGTKSGMAEDEGNDNMAGIKKGPLLPSECAGSRQFQSDDEGQQSAVKAVEGSGVVIHDDD